MWSKWFFFLNYFEDDLFDEEDDSPKKKVSKETAAPKQKYLDQKWKLAEEDAKEFNGWTKKEGTHERLMERLDAMEEVAPADRIPSIALIYNFRREYKDQNLEATLADHRAHCLKFNKRLLHSEVINTRKTKGVVLLWVGLSPEDDLVRQDMMNFMEEDPLIVKDIVDNWNIQVLKTTTSAITVEYGRLTVPGPSYDTSDTEMLHVSSDHLSLRILVTYPAFVACLILGKN